MASSLSTPGMRAPTMPQRGPRILMGSSLALAAAVSLTVARRSSCPRACEQDACCTHLCSSSMCLSAPPSRQGRGRVDPSDCIMYGEVDLTDKERRMLDCRWVRLKQSVNV